MSKLIMWNVVTLDGFFEGAKKWDLGFHQTVWGDELERFSIEQLKTADRLIFGRVTYEGMAAYWQSETDEVANFMNTLPKVVFSRTLERADWNNTRLIKDATSAAINDLKRDGDKNTFVFGSANLCSTLMQHNLFDEYRFALAPIVLGTGNPLFQPAASQLKLKLLDSRALSNGCVILRYAPLSNQ